MPKSFFMIEKALRSEGSRFRPAWTWRTMERKAKKGRSLEEGEGEGEGEGIFRRRLNGVLQGRKDW